MPKSLTKIALAGIKGSFSEEAAAVWLHNTNQLGQMVYTVTAAKTFAAVKADSAGVGIVPLENSNGGIVLETVYALADYKCQIKDIFEIDVQQNLIAKPGIKLDQIKQVVSHPQALAQCKFYLRRRWPKVELIEYQDTALAAKDLASGKLDQTTAVIAASQAAKIFGLQVLEPSVQDLKFNFTSFLVFTDVK